ncbi:MAG: glycosyltransferase family 4 protein [Peptococcaceae bacterium]|nr:glycosyltransferase family 4 protein [Peptococcaceae bacterium]
MRTIKMKSKADLVKGQGVLSAYHEQVNLVSQGLEGKYKVATNKMGVYDITHFHTLFPFWFLNVPLAKQGGAVVGYVHFLPETLENSIKIPWPFKTLFYKFLTAFYKNMDYLVTVNPVFVTKLIALGIDSEKVHYIPNYVDEKTFFPYDSDEKLRLRKEYGYDAHEFLVLGVGQLQTRKGVCDFIEVARQRPDMKFLWAGGFSFGTMSDGYAQIKASVESAPENVRFMDLVNREEMNTLYNMADVLLLPSFQELFPMTILEAMNCRLPILLRDLDEYKEILFDYYLKGNSVDDFVQELGALQSDRVFYDSWCERSWVGHQYYSRERILAKWEAFYDMVYEKTQGRKAKRRGALRKTDRDSRDVS